MQEILKFKNSFTSSSPSHLVNFLRKLYNFACHVRPVVEKNDKQRRKRQVIERFGSGLTSMPTQSKRQKTEGTTGTGTGTGTGGNGAPPATAVNDLVCKYQIFSCEFKPALSPCPSFLTLFQNRNILRTLSKSERADLVAKWTTHASEVELIKSLQPATHAQFRNSVIQVIDDLRHGTLGTFLFMPRYTPLDSLHHITPTNYHAIHLQVIEGVAFLHAHHVAHRDLKPANIVVNLQGGSSVIRTYIIDFGNARRCTPGYRCKGFQGTRGWTAPEVQDGIDWEPMSADVWAMANTLKYLAKIARTPDQDMSSVVACHEPASRPTASDLFNKPSHHPS
ncbi:hypothetical protein FRB95_001383 [Tulasnella sp. JGI-2019a]|nr:hypothetical protein FRB95_001383 [Tulasnella sp. JGI-2019a]